MPHVSTNGILRLCTMDDRCNPEGAVDGRVRTKIERRSADEFDARSNTSYGIETEYLTYRSGRDRVSPRLDRFGRSS